MKTSLQLFTVALLILSSFTLLVLSSFTDIQNGETGNIIDGPEPHMEQTQDDPSLYASYHSNGELKHIYNVKTLEYSSYYFSGQIEEKGLWINNHQIGKFIQYHNNGNLRCEFNYNSAGKKEGVQVYYHNNGAVAISGNWLNGKEDGLIIRYDSNEDVKSIARYSDGKLDQPALVRYHDIGNSNNTVKNFQSFNLLKPAEL